MSIIKHKAQRVADLIDAQSMYHSAKHLYNARVNVKEAHKAAVAGRELVRATSYVIRTETGEEKSFLEALVKTGIETQVKDLQIFPGGVKKADWDVGMAMDAVRFADGPIDAVVLVTGDGDFVPLIEYLKARGKQAEVVAFGRSTSQKLKEAADDFIDLGTEPRKYLMRIK
jgi:uncharacterized protein (TIGR00288 family)